MRIEGEGRVVISQQGDRTYGQFFDGNQRYEIGNPITEAQRTIEVTWGTWWVESNEKGEVRYHVDPKVPT